MRPPSTRRLSGDLVKYATTAGSDTRDKNSHLLCTMHVVKGDGAQLRVVTSPSGSWSQLPSQGAGSTRLRVCTEQVFLYMTMEIVPVLFDGFLSIPGLLILSTGQSHYCSTLKLARIFWACSDLALFLVPFVALRDHPTNCLKLHCTSSCQLLVTSSSTRAEEKVWTRASPSNFYWKSRQPGRWEQKHRR